MPALVNVGLRNVAVTSIRTCCTWLTRPTSEKEMPRAFVETYLALSMCTNVCTSVDPLLVNASGQQQTETTTCPTDLLVPSWIDATATTTVAMVTYPSGATGATGATGQLVNSPA